MAKVKVHTPDETGQAHAATPAPVANFVVTDGRGRQLTLRRPHILQRLNLIKILGDHAANAMYWANVAPVLYLAAIDGEAIAAPISQKQLDALLQRLDEDGLLAIVKGVNEYWPPEEEEAHNDAVKE